MAQLEKAIDYGKVDEIINASLNALQSPNTTMEFLVELEDNLEQVSPLSCTSVQWSCYRYAMIRLHELIKQQKTALLCH
ncbi:hypothetical protein [Pedobacter sp. MC2016-24]|uniref:hypothetical protein n=1 Tax=Pedobacter sp. MC2016-24 TaxID=2780090 RepID=UPI00187F18F2|nr:hypothetical protein [Pedobacter sp. MC2016-24]MBE9600862.1 hypothetical protein [Pedobacter sp. MC2016-24]